LASRKGKEPYLANRAYLLTVDDKSVTWSEDPEKEILAEGMNEIPVFWASLFRAGDRHLDEYEGGDGKLQVANWCSEAEAAKERLKRLRPTVAALLDERSRALWEQWIEFLTAQECRFFKTNAAEVWGLDPEGYEDYWAALLRAFEEPSSETMKAAIERNDLSYVKDKVSWDDDEETTCKLAGADHIRNLPWLD
jgi:hypothetical protein